MLCSRLKMFLPFKIPILASRTSYSSHPSHPPLPPGEYDEMMSQQHLYTSNDNCMHYQQHQTLVVTSNFIVGPLLLLSKVIFVLSVADTITHCPASPDKSGQARQAALNETLIPNCRKTIIWYDSQYFIPIENTTWIIIASLLPCWQSMSISKIISTSPLNSDLFL